MTKEQQAYKGIFKSTFLFGFVQIFNIAIKVALNKVIAIYLGTNGVGIIGLYQSAIAFIRTFSSMGVHQSAVKDISEVRDIIGERDRFYKTIKVVKNIVIATSLLGVLITISLSLWLSRWTFKNDNYIISFMLLSLVVLFNVLTEGYLSILKGARQLRDLAKASMLGAFGGVVSGIPIYIYFGSDGIVPALILFAFSTFFFAYLFVRKIDVGKIKVSIQEVIKEGASMVHMGFSLMITSFIAYVSEFVVRSYIANTSGIEQVGLFQVGATILTAYFGIVITALVTDYYPRIAAVNQNNNLIEEELNRQIKVGFLLLGPLIVGFIFFLKPCLILLYSKEFLASAEYIVYAIFGILITIASNPMDLVLVAKAEAKLFLVISIFYRGVEMAMFILGYKLGGLTGLGIAVTGLSALHFIIMYAVNRWKYRIFLHQSTWKIMIFIILLTFLSVFTYNVEVLLLRITIGFVVVIVSLIYANHVLKGEMKIDVVAWLNEKRKAFISRK